MNKKIIAIIMTAVVLFPTNSITALASNSGLEVQGSNSIYSTTDEVENGSYTIDAQASVVEETENQITVDNKNNISETKDSKSDVQTETGQTDTQQAVTGQTGTQTDTQQAVTGQTGTQTDTQQAGTGQTDTQTSTQQTGTGQTDTQTSTQQTDPGQTNTQQTDTGQSVDTQKTDILQPVVLGPKAVEDLKYKAIDYNSITLNWKASEGATKYIVYRSTSEIDGYEKVKTTKSTTYKQSKLSCGKVYYYKVIPYADVLAGAEKIIKVNTKPTKISNLKTSVNNTTVKLTWEKGKGAQSYNIYRSTKKNSDFAKIGETKKLKYDDKNLERGKSYYYRVYPVSNETEGAKVATKEASRILNGPKAVKSLKYKSKNYNTVTLSWKASKGATKYVIYRSTSEDGKYKKVKTTESTTYEQSKLSCGATYYYKVIPYADSLSGKETIIKVATKPAKVTNLKASVNGATIKLTWKKGKGASSYYVYRSTDKSSGFEKVGETTKTTYYDENLASGTTYYYRIYSVSNETMGAKVTCNATIPNADTSVVTNIDTSGEMRATWISYLDYGTLKDKSKSEFTNNINKMYDNVLSQNLNTVIVHVRAFGDAVYPSGYYNWANFITSDSNGLDYDPLAIMVEEAHKKGLSFHAWINPYRTADGGRVNPASSSAVKKIVSGVEEIVTNYNVDGIHFDDYFYLSTDDTSQEIKMQNVNKMVQSVYAKIKSIKSNVVFGISPAGNVEYAKSIGCDVDTWLSTSGYVDYICPQLYWSDDYVTKSGASTKMFTNTMKQWSSINKNNTTMYAGLALYKVGVSLETAWGSDYGWGNSNSNLCDQYKAAKNAGYSGYSLYRYGSFGLSAAKEELENLKKLSQ